MKLFTDPPANIREMNDENRELFSYLSKHSGQNITNVRQVEFLYSTLLLEEGAGLTLPEWTVDVYPDKVRPLSERSLEMITETPFMKRIKGGALVTDIADKMLMKQSKMLKPDRSIFIYSGHDVTLVNVMNSLGILPQTSRLPDFASALVFELHRSVIFGDNEFNVKLLFYRNSDDDTPKMISIPNCSDPCSLEQFIVSIKPIEMKFDDYDDLCKVV